MATRYEGLSGSSTLPAKSSVRRGSQLAPPPPPVRRTPSIFSGQGRTSPQHISRDGGDASADEGDNASRASLIQALNARFSKPQAGLRFSLPACHAEDGSDLPLPEPPDVLDHQDGTFPDPPPPPEQPEGCKQVHPEKKLLRAHTIGYSQRDALIQSLNAKFSTAAAEALQSSAGTVVRSLHEGHRAPRMTSATDLFRANLEQSLKHDKKEQRLVPAETRRSRSVGPCAEKTSSVERRQFLNTLNARLAEQHNSAAGQSPRRGSLQPQAEFRRKSTDADRASRVQSWLAGRGSVDLTACRESLLDQIRQGTALKRVSSQNDRSTPHVL